jgi:putative mRNA 3-end processing factor
MSRLIEFHSDGLYCPQADVFIDPWNPQKKAIITHAHADHARWGMESYLAHQDSAEVLKLRLGQDIKLQTLDYNQSISINGVKVSLHPAGHIYGSAQVRLEFKGEIWVASGDYKLEHDGLATDFESVKCHHFITESTFGMPVYQWPKQEDTFRDINAWWQNNKNDGKTSVLFAYSLGKSQRILHHLDNAIGEVFLHGAIFNTNEALIRNGAPITSFEKVSDAINKARYKGSLIIAPPSAANSSWMKKFNPYATGVSSGWMMIRGAKRRQAADRGFILSDHADWEDLNKAVFATGAENIYVTHGYTAVYAKWLCEQGLNAEEVKTMFEGDAAEAKEEGEIPL